MRWSSRRTVPSFSKSKPGDTYPNGIKGRDGLGRPGLMHMDMAKGLLTAQGLGMTDLAGYLSRQLGTTVLDKTALTGNYDFTLHWAPDESQLAMFKGLPTGQHEIDNTSAPESSGPSIFTALQEQLGLELKSQTGSRADSRHRSCRGAVGKLASWRVPQQRLHGSRLR